MHAWYMTFFELHRPPKGYSQMYDALTVSVLIDRFCLHKWLVVGGKWLYNHFDFLESMITEEWLVILPRILPNSFWIRVFLFF